MGVASWLFGCLGRVGLGRPRGLLSRKAGRLTVVHCCVGWLVVVVGVEDTPAVVGCCGLVVVVVCWWWVPPCLCVGVACCRGSGVVRPGCLTCLGLPLFGGCGWVWVGWL